MSLAAKIITGTIWGIAAVVIALATLLLSWRSGGALSIAQAQGLCNSGAGSFAQALSASTMRNCGEIGDAWTVAQWARWGVLLGAAAGTVLIVRRGRKRTAARHGAVAAQVPPGGWR